MASNMDYWAAGKMDGRFMCPISCLEVNGKNKFSAIWGSGLVVSQRTIKQIPLKDLFEVAGGAFTKDDIIKLNRDDAEYEEVHADVDNAPCPERSAALSSRFSKLSFGQVVEPSPLWTKRSPRRAPHSPTRRSF